MPVVLATDDQGGIHMFMQRLDAQWTEYQIFNRPSTLHVALDAEYDAATYMLYIGHITEAAGPPKSQTVHFMAFDLGGPAPIMTDRMDDVETAPYIGQVQTRLDAGGVAWMIYDAGTLSLAVPPVVDMELVFQQYNAGTGLTEQRETLLNPLFFDVQPDGAQWKLLVTDAAPVIMSGYTVYWNLLRLFSGTPGNWGTPEEIYSGTASASSGVTTYDFPWECAMLPSTGKLFFARGVGEIDAQNLLSAPTLTLWSAVPPAAPVEEAAPTLGRLNLLHAPGGDFLLGKDIPSFSINTVASQLDFPGGPLWLRDVQ